MKRRLKKIIIRLFLAMTVIALSITLLGYRNYRVALQQKPLAETIQTIQNQPNYVRIDQVPLLYRQAVVATEDRRFYQRDSAFDLRSFLRAMWVNLSTLSLSQGASTLPQQVGKNIYFDYQTDLLQKVAQMFLMADIEKHYSKDEILELYINVIYFGDGYTGIYDAAQGYFNKSPAELTDSEAVILAGLPQSPSRFQLSTGFDLARQRQRDVLDNLVSENYLSAQAADEIFAQPIAH